MGYYKHKSYWLKGTMPYSICSDSFPVGSTKRKIIIEAITYFNEQTKANIIERTIEKDYVKFVIGKSCSSYVGRVGGAQLISCNILHGYHVSQVIHEIAHAFGLHHEHQRIDRDDHIQVIDGNIKLNRLLNFTIMKGKVFGVYDYGSLMHYGRFAFTKNRGATILAHHEIGQRSELSIIDIATINHLVKLSYNKPGIFKIIRLQINRFLK